MPDEKHRFDWLKKQCQNLPLQTFLGESMPNVYLTEQMEHYIRGQIRLGTYANVSEVVCAAVRLLMEQDNACQFYALKAELEEALREAEAGEFEVFDPQAYEPEFRRE